MTSTCPVLLCCAAFPTDFSAEVGILWIAQVQENAGGRLNYTGGESAHELECNNHPAGGVACFWNAHMVSLMSTIV